MEEVTSWKQLEVGQWISLGVFNLEQIGLIHSFKELTFIADMWEVKNGEVISKIFFPAELDTRKDLKKLSRTIYIYNKKEIEVIKKKILLMELK